MNFYDFVITAVKIVFVLLVIFVIASAMGWIKP